MSQIILKYIQGSNISQHLYKKEIKNFLEKQKLKEYNSTKPNSKYLKVFSKWRRNKKLQERKKYNRRGKYMKGLKIIT